MAIFSSRKAVLFVIVLVAAVGAAAAVYFLRGPDLRTPDVVGRGVGLAEGMAMQRGLRILVDHREPHPTIPRDTVISQSPAADSAAEPGHVIRVVVSQGPGDQLAPNFTGLYFREAELKIQEAGFVQGPGAKASSDSVERGYVIAQSPAAGSQLSKGGTISLLVSAGKKNRFQIMPELIGMPVDKALQELEKMELTYSVQQAGALDKPTGLSGTVATQNPKPGFPVSADAAVVLTTNK
jgi:beta-lactam-binding protein with PASTA domain